MSDENQRDAGRVIRWGIIGCGDVTEVKSGPAFQRTDGFELVAVTRRDLDKARDYARRHGVPKVHADAAALIADPEVDAVYIATPPDSHAHFALKVAVAGKPCCVEKPMASSHAECVEMLTAFEEKKIPLFVAYYRRCLPRFTRVKRWLEEGLIGEPRHVSWRFSQPPSELDCSKEYNWRTDARVAAGGYFDDLASHGLDLIAYFLGDYEEVAGLGVNQQGLYTAKDALTACWVHESAATGAASWTFGSAMRSDRVEVLGSAGSIECAIFEDAPIRLTTADGRVEELMIDHPKHVQEPHVRAMRDALFGEGVHPSSGATALRTAWVMDRILGRV